MEPIVIGVAVGAVFVLVTALLVHAHRAGDAVTEEPPVLKVAFRVLRTPEELFEAVQRAAENERRAAQGCFTRADRYEAMLVAAKVPASADTDREQLSA